MSKQRKRKQKEEAISTVYLVLIIVLVTIVTLFVETFVVTLELSQIGLLLVMIITVLWWLRTR